MKEFVVHLVSASRVTVIGDDAQCYAGIGDLIIKRGADIEARFAAGQWSYYIVHEAKPGQTTTL